MAESKIRGLDQVTVDMTNLYREETFTDLAVATIRRHTPVKSDGTDDPARPPLFTGQASLMTEGGALPLSFVIEAKNLEEAFKKFPAEMEKGYEKMLEEVREYRREQASRIVVPTGPMPSVTGANPAQGPSKIRLR
ncbi:MAG: hypothetical protein J0L75_13455 [Spirochaetes bacterium]|nr:hypothetical protein [Spirochaetota bacterium]